MKWIPRRRKTTAKMRARVIREAKDRYRKIKGNGHLTPPKKK